MEDLQARQNIPEIWAANAHCVLCGYTPLVVEQKEQAPDQIKCPRCGLSIVLDESGQYICISCLPKALQGSNNPGWMKAPELINYLKLAYAGERTPSPSPFIDIKPEGISAQEIAVSPQTSSNPEKIDFAPPLTGAEQVANELAFKAKGLFDLGNPSWKIRQILKDSSKYSDEQINSVIQTIEAEEKRKNNSGALKIATILVVLLVVCGLAAGAINLATSVFFPKIDEANKAANSVSTRVSNARTQNPPLVPAEISTFAPPGTNIINVPTPYVVQQQPDSPTASDLQSTAAPINPGVSNNLTSSGPTKRFSCPLNSRDAAALFGGSEKNWSLQQDQWVLLDNNGTTINLPQGMSAGYLVASNGMEIKSVLGPAHIANIYMIMISCK
jgi:hypothetical protein